MIRKIRFEQLGLPAILISLLVGATARGATSSVSLAWNASTNATVIGYHIYYGGSSGAYTSVVSTGNVTTAVVPGLIEGDTYYFAVTAYDANGDESAFSNEISYIVPGVLAISPGATPGSPFRIRFPVAAGQQYQVQASQDLQTWTTLVQSTAVSNVWLEFDDPQSGLTQRFYRLLFN